MIDLLEYHLRHIELERCGFGPDEYAPGESHEHAMAYALYLRGLATLHRLTGDTGHLDRARIVRDRLLELTWGLPFAYRDLPAGHPYTITTAIAGSAFAALARADERDDAASEGVERAVHWLLDELPWADGVPTYAPGFPAVTHNVSAMVAGFLAEAGRDEGRGALEAVRAAQHPLGLWSYGPSWDEQPSGLPWESVVDSLHSAYVLDGLLCCFAPGDVEAGPAGGALGEAIDAGLRFFETFLVRADGQLREKVVLTLPDEPETARLLRGRAPRAYVDSDHWLILLAEPARLWSLGAWARTLGLAIEAGLRPAPAGFASADRLFGSVLTESSGRYPYRRNEPGTCFPRHEAHLFDGLCTLTCALEGRGARAAAVHPSAAGLLATPPVVAG